MDKKDIELERLKIEREKLILERLKIMEGLLRTFIFSILTLGAGAGALIFRLYNSKAIDKFILTLLIALILVFSIISIFLWLDIRRNLRRF